MGDDARCARLLHVALDKVAQRAHVVLHHRPQQQPRLEGQVLHSRQAKSGAIPVHFVLRIVI